MKSKKLQSYCYGLKKSIPVLIGFLPVAVTYAITANGAGMSVGETIAMSAAVFAGASQIMAVEMLAGGAGMLSIVLATFVLNLRHIIMSTCVFEKLHCKNWMLRLLCGFGVSDEPFVLYTTEDDEHCNEYFMLGLITMAYGSWVLGAVVGVFANRLLPDSISKSFGIALYALFIALVIPGVKKHKRLPVVIAITILLNSVASLWLPSSWAIIFSTLISAAIGVWVMGGSMEPKAAAEEEALQ